MPEQKGFSNYHIEQGVKHLLARGIIEQKDNGYVLSEFGCKTLAKEVPKALESALHDTPRHCNPNCVITTTLIMTYCAENLLPQAESTPVTVMEIDDGVRALSYVVPDITGVVCKAWVSRVYDMELENPSRNPF